MYFYLDNLDIEYGVDDDLLIFIFINDTNHKIIIKYWSIQDGGHQEFIYSYKNNQKCGTQHQWYAIQHGGHQSSIENYKNDQQHGTQYHWWPIQEGGHQASITNYKNGQQHGTQQYWKRDWSYITNHY
jgi:antitoxin component YwqK of YwqJK toxin-antitoxin module